MFQLYPSLNRADHSANVIYFGAGLPFANIGSSVKVCVETLS